MRRFDRNSNLVDIFKENCMKLISRTVCWMAVHED